MKIGNANTQVYEYDKLYQIKSVDYNDGNTAGYEYDKMGNRKRVMENQFEIIYDSNALNQYTSVSGTPYAYDRNGNLIDDGTFIYNYDCENRLIEVRQNGNVIAEYKYDFAGRRVAKTVGSTTTTFVYDGDQIIQEYRDDYGRWKTYYYGPGVDELIRMIGWENPGEPGLSYYYDGLGSVVALADYMGNVVEKYSYDVFGKPTIKNANGTILTTSSVGNRFMFTGREYDVETGNYYYRARYYKPSIGRFLQPDPIGYADSLNLYSYVGNNPLRWIDPWGLCKLLAMNNNDLYQLGTRELIELEKALLELMSELWNADHNKGFFPWLHDCGPQAKELMQYLNDTVNPKYWRLRVEGRSQTNSEWRQNHFFGFPGNQNKIVATPIGEAARFGYKPFTIDPFRDWDETWIPWYRNWDVDFGPYDDFLHNYPFYQYY